MENKDIVLLLSEIKEILRGNHPEPDQVYDVPGAASFLQLSESTCYYYLEQKIIPHKKIGKHYRMLRSKLIEWLMNDKTKVMGETISNKLEKKSTKNV